MTVVYCLTSPNEVTLPAIYTGTSPDHLAREIRLAMKAHDLCGVDCFAKIWRPISPMTYMRLSYRDVFPSNLKIFFEEQKQWKP